MLKKEQKKGARGQQEAMLRLFGKEGDLEELVQEKMGEAVREAERVKKELQEVEQSLSSLKDAHGREM